MPCADKFTSLAQQWVHHCRSTVLSSDIRDYLEHPAYRGLVDLGMEAVPYIIERYREDDLAPWGFLLDDITGLQMIENRSRFKPAEVKQRWLEWWAKQSAAGGANHYPNTSTTTKVEQTT